MTKKELIKATKSRYLKSSKIEKGKILDEFCANARYTRKYAITILQAGYDNNHVAREGRKKRKRKYSPRTYAVVMKLWTLLEYPCGVRLKPQLVPLLEALERWREISTTTEVKKQLQQISARTLDRRLKKEREIRKLNRNRGTTRHGSLLKSSIPIRITSFDTHQLGFVEMDTVAHNGGDQSGECLYSLDVVEIYSGWSEQRAVLGKGEKGIVAALDDMKATMPFHVRGMDSDSGSEFINWHLVRYCDTHKIFFTRSRPDRKNDNAYVEQKNYTHIRTWFGYGRFDNKEQMNAFNDLYQNELRLFNNFFRPVMKITSKEKVNNSVCKKKYDVAQTPYQRLIASRQISQKVKQELTRKYLTLNPIKLKKTIDQKMKKIRKTCS